MFFEIKNGTTGLSKNLGDWEFGIFRCFLLGKGMEIKKKKGHKSFGIFKILL